MISVRSLNPDEWPLWREVRLLALQDSPDAFGSTYEREISFEEATGDWATSDGAQLLALWVADVNLRAVRFYERAGFTPTGRTSFVRPGSDIPSHEMSRKL